jgi:hypothetical protein
LIVAAVSYAVARLQRKADAERLDRQMKQDRELRAEEMLAASSRLDGQLMHDREVRDLAHAREVLSEIVAQVLNPKPISGLIDAMNEASRMPVADRRLHVTPHIEAIDGHSVNLTLAWSVLLVLVEDGSPLATTLQGVKDAVNHQSELAEAWLGGTIDDGLRTLQEDGRSYGRAVGAFLHEVYEAVGWHRDEAKAAARNIAASL